MARFLLKRLGLATITLFLLIMAVLMIPCSKLTDRYGRKRCFIVGLALYGNRVPQLSRAALRPSKA